jgi:hypothetical protein
VVVGVSAIGSSLLVQQALCWLCRVPFRSTFGETFQWRLSYLGGLPKQDRDAILARLATEANDPVITEALDALDQSLDQGEKWADMFLLNKINEILDGSAACRRSGWQCSFGKTGKFQKAALKAQPCLDCCHCFASA